MNGDVVRKESRDVLTSPLTHVNLFPVGMFWTLMVRL